MTSGRAVLRTASAQDFEGRASGGRSFKKSSETRFSVASLPTRTERAAWAARLRTTAGRLACDAFVASQSAAGN